MRAWLLALLFTGGALAQPYYVAPSGSDAAPGTLAQPLATLNRAVQLAVPNDTIYMRGGVYPLTQGVTLNKERITISVYPGEQPILDAAPMTQTGWTAGWPLALSNAGWARVEGLEIKNGPEGGITLVGNTHDSIIENNNVHHNGRLSQWEGKGISIYGTSYNNQIINNSSHHNRDLQGTNADGFQIGTSGAGNVLRNNRAYRNADDGFDFWNGAACTVESNRAWENGYDDTLTPVGDGNGYKLGGQSAGRASGGHLVRNNLAWGNRRNGFDENSASAPSTLYNNTAYNNGAYNYSFWERQNTFRNNVSFGSPSGVSASGSSPYNSWSVPIVVKASDFLSLDPVSSDFLHLSSGSQLIDRGVDVGLPYLGAAPDLGAFESAFIAPAPAPAPAPTPPKKPGKKR